MQSYIYLFLFAIVFLLKKSDSHINVNQISNKVPSYRYLQKLRNAHLRSRNYENKVSFTSQQLSDIEDRFNFINKTISELVDVNKRIVTPSATRENIKEHLRTKNFYELPVSVLGAIFNAYKDELVSDDVNKYIIISKLNNILSNINQSLNDLVETHSENLMNKTKADLNKFYTNLNQILSEESNYHLKSYITQYMLGYGFRIEPTDLLSKMLAISLHSQLILIKNYQHINSVFEKVGNKSILQKEYPNFENVFMQKEILLLVSKFASNKGGYMA